MSVEFPVFLTSNILVGPEKTIADLVAFVQDVVYGWEGFKPNYWAALAEVMDEAQPGASHRSGAMPGDVLQNGAADALDRGFVIAGSLGGIGIRKLDPDNPDPEHLSYGALNGWRLYFLTDDYEQDEDAYLASVAFYAHLFTEAALRLSALRGELVRESPTYLGPEPPHALHNALVQIVSTDEIAESYGMPDEYWSQWDLTVYAGHGRAVVSRGLTVVDETEFKELAAVRGIALGQAAKPGASEFRRSNLSSAERRMVDGMESFLEQIGLDPQTQILEFSAFVPEDEHLTAQDFQTLIKFNAPRKKNSDQIKSVRIAFPDQAMAMREWPLLASIGVEVIYLNGDASWVPLKP